jgi:hypothetical protein
MKQKRSHAREDVSLCGLDTPVITNLLAKSHTLYSPTVDDLTVEGRYD